MRNFIISLICISVLLCSWTAFAIYSNKTLHDCQIISSKMINDSIPNEQWDAADKDFKQLIKVWNKYKPAAHFFLDSKDINEIDCTLKKAHLYMHAYDISNSTGEIAYVRDKFKMLYNNDSPTIFNIF